MMTNTAVPLATPAPMIALSPEWRCFHCDELFTDREQARLHFGTFELQSPACTLDITYLRELEAEVKKHREEDTELHHQIAGNAARTEEAKRRAEEAGYARGLRDAGYVGAPEDLPEPKDNIVGRAALDQFCTRYCHDRPELVSLAESAFYWFNKVAAAAAGPGREARVTEIKQAIRKQMKFHKLTEHGDGVVEADIAYAVLDVLASPAPSPRKQATQNG